MSIAFFSKSQAEYKCKISMSCFSFFLFFVVVQGKPNIMKPTLHGGPEAHRKFRSRGKLRRDRSTLSERHNGPDMNTGYLVIFFFSKSISHNLARFELRCNSVFCRGLICRLISGETVHVLNPHTNMEKNLRC